MLETNNNSNIGTAPFDWQTDIPPALPHAEEKLKSSNLFKLHSVKMFADETEPNPDPKHDEREFVEHHFPDTDVGRHYVQPCRNWGSSDDIKTLFSRLDIPLKNTDVTVIGGYTGEYATTLDTLGANVLFTDPLPEWCQVAKNNGLPTKQKPAEKLSQTTLEGTQLTTSFETFQPLQGNDPVYTMLRLASVEYGHVLLESEYTREDMNSAVTLLTDYNWIETIFGGITRYREHDGLRAYHFHGSEDTRSKMRQVASTFYAATHVILEIASNNSLEIPVEQNDWGSYTLTDTTLHLVAEYLNSSPEPVYNALKTYHRCVIEKMGTAGKYLPPGQIHSDVLRIGFPDHAISEREVLPFSETGYSIKQDKSSLS